METSKKQLAYQEKGSNESTKLKKKDANLKYSPTLYFLIGLAISLFSTYSLFEIKFERKNSTSTTILSSLIEDTYIYDDVNFVVETQKEVIKKEQKPLGQDPVISDAPTVVEPPIFIDEPSAPENPAIPIDSVSVIEPDYDPEFMITVVEHVPEYPGCEKGSNTEKRKCMSAKIAKFVQRKFNTDLAGDLGLSGRQRISVIFKIDKNGNVTGVRSRAPHPRLEKEAVRVINLLPKMKPGRQRGKAVVVPYSLPITFQVQD